MPSNERRPRWPSSPAAGALAVTVVLAAIGCSSSGDPAPRSASPSPAVPSGSGTTEPAVAGTSPPTVVRRPAGTAPPGTIGTSSGTAPPGTNVAVPNESIEPDDVAEDVTWTATATDHQGDDGLLVAYDCTPDGIEATVWGDGVYTDDSSVCTAAVFEGLITVASGGRVVIQITGGRDAYAAATANGITTLAYAGWPGSFWFPGR